MAETDFNVPYLTSSAANASSFVLRALPGGVMDIFVNTTTANIWLLVLDVAAAPGPGDVSGNPLVYQVQVPSGSTFAMGFDPPVGCAIGATMLASTTQYPTFTASATCQFGGRVR